LAAFFAFAFLGFALGLLFAFFAFFAGAFFTFFAAFFGFGAGEERRGAAAAGVSASSSGST
jgi:hypothetical protein